jgi:hypothetical protein
MNGLIASRVDTGDELVPVSETSFSVENLYERKNIQQLLLKHIEVLSDRLMVIAEEFGDWLDSSRRIDLLCLDTDANLVVVELKRTEDGGHMELQALRYAAMISAMTFDQLVETHARFRNPSQPDFEAARAVILEFLRWTAPNEDHFGQDTRIILAAANFSKELTTAVLWLIDRGIDIRCVRLKPYRMSDGPVLLDIQQLIPLPETANFQTQIGVKRQAERLNRGERHDIRYKFWEGLLAYAKPLTPIHGNRKPTQDGWISGGIGRAGFSLTYAVRQTDSQVELWISHGKERAAVNMEAFEQLKAQKTDIESRFGHELEWMDLPESDGCRIRFITEGGWRSSSDQWPQIYENMVGAMIRLNEAVRGPVMALKI